VDPKGQNLGSLVLPIGQQLWLTELESYQKFPPLQAPESYNLSQVMEEVKKANANTAGEADPNDHDVTNGRLTIGAPVKCPRRSFLQEMDRGQQ
jgi:hypothetical protein